MIENPTAIRDLFIETASVKALIRGGKMKELSLHDGEYWDMCNMLAHMWWNDNDGRTADGDRLGFAGFVGELKKHGVTIREIRDDLHKNCDKFDMAWNLTGGSDYWNYRRNGEWLDGYIGTWEDYAESFPMLSRGLLKSLFNGIVSRTEILPDDFYNENKKELERDARKEMEHCKSLDDLDGMFRRTASTFDMHMKETIKAKIRRAIREELAERLEKQAGTVTAMRDIDLDTGCYAVTVKNGEITRLEAHNERISCGIGGLIIGAWGIHSRELLTGDETRDYNELIRGLLGQNVSMREIAAEITAVSGNETTCRELSGGHQQWDEEYGECVDGQIGGWEEYTGMMAGISRGVVRSAYLKTGVDTKNLWLEFYGENRAVMAGFIKSGLVKCSSLDCLDGMFCDIEQKAEALITKTVKRLKARKMRAHIAEALQGRPDRKEA